MERVKTNIERKSRIEGDRVVIDSQISEDMTVEQFFDSHNQRIQQLNNMQNQLAGVKAQMNQYKKPEMSAEEEKELMELKQKINKIRDIDKLETLQQNAQKLEVEINRVQKESLVFQETVKKLEESNKAGGEKK